MSLQTRIALILWLLALLGASLSAALLMRRVDAELIEGARTTLINDTRLQANLFLRKVDEARRDVGLMAGTPPIAGLQRSLANDGVDPLDGSTAEQWRHRLNDIFAELLANKPGYVQARYIGFADGGRELVRVHREADGRLLRCTADQLQQKGEEPYMQDGRGYAPGTAHASSISLNREHGRIVQPPEPVLRVFTTIVTPTGEPYGLVIINLEAGALLARVAEAPGRQRRYYLTDGDGHYLWHPDPSRRFELERDAKTRPLDELPLLGKVMAGSDPASSMVDDVAELVVAARVVRYGTATDQRRLGIVAVDSFDSITEVTDRTLRDIVAMVFAIAAFAVVFAFFLARLVTRPVATLTEAVRTMDLATATIQAPKNLTGEAAELAEALHRAFEALGEHNAELAAKNRELEQFAYVASHDLQEPLRTLTSFANLLEKDLGPDLAGRPKDAVRFILASSERMRELVHALLEYSRLGRERALERVDLGEVVSLALADLQSAIDESGAELDVGPLPTIRGQRVELRLLFQNLVDNALKFRRPGAAPTIAIRAERKGAEWELSVCDDGIGIAEEHRDQIFMIFQRLHARDAYPGTGIGLAHCRKIVDIHGGSIWADANEGGGTCIRFRLPAGVET